MIDPLFAESVGANLPLTAIRLRERMDEVGMSQGELADAIGATQGAISQILTGLTRNSRLLPKMASALCINLDWLAGLSDEKIDMFDAAGDELSEDDLAAIRAGKSSKRLKPDARLSDRRMGFAGAVPERDPDMVEIAEIDLRYGLGGTYLDGPVIESKRAFSRSLLRHFTHSAPENLFWTLGDGDSMEPTIRSGELILIDRSQVSPRMGDGIWAFAWGDVGMIKRLRPLPDGTVEIHSDNQLVRPALAADGELHVIGRVVAIVRKC